MLIGHGSDYFMDEGEGRLGLLHNRKRAGPAPARAADRPARRTLHAAALLETDRRWPASCFATNELVFRVNDRLAAAEQRRRVRGPASPSSTPCARSSSAWARASFTRVGGPKELLSCASRAATSRRSARCSSARGGRPPPTRRWSSERKLYRQSIGSPNTGKRLLLLAMRVSLPKVSLSFQCTGLVATTVCCLAPGASVSEKATVNGIEL